MGCSSLGRTSFIRSPHVSITQLLDFFKSQTPVVYYVEHFIRVLNKARSKDHILQSISASLK